jgi:hypothetical protein
MIILITLPTVTFAISMELPRISYISWTGRARKVPPATFIAAPINLSTQCNERKMAEIIEG